MSKHSVNRCLVAGMVLLLVGPLGCGTGRYEERLEATVDRLGKESLFSQMQPPVELPGTPVTIQLPQFFEQSPLREDTDARRLKPPSIELPDLKFTYEGFYDGYGDGSKIAIYCYVAAPPMKGSGTRTPADRLRSALQTAIPGWSGELKSVQCRTPTGRAVEWQHLEGTIKQEFYFINTEGNEEYREADATLEFFCRQEGDVMLIIGWRVPSPIVEHIGPEGDRGLEKWASRVPGSVRVKQ